jgi:hypothetical protein
VYEQFGTYGAWLNPALGDAPRIEYAPQLEELGYQWRASNLPDCGPNRVRFGKESRSGTKIREIQARVS